MWDTPYINIPKDIFDEQAYIKNSNLQKTATRNAINTYGDLVQFIDGGTIMDVGCGDGATTAQILKPFIESRSANCILSGSDLSDAMVDIANARYKDETINFHQLDIATHKLENNFKESFDNIFSFFCLQIVPNYRKWMENVYAMLKPNGQIFLLMPAQNPMSTEFVKQSNEGIWSKYLITARLIFDTPIAQHPDPIPWISDLMTEHQFKNLVCKSINEDYVFPNAKSLRAFLETFKVMYQNVPKDLLDDFLDELTALIGKKCLKIEGHEIHFQYSLILVIANK